MDYNRQDLFSILKCIWEDAISRLYKKGIIHNERQLQGYLFKYLVDATIDKYQIWVEPDVIIDSKTYKPDMIITESNTNKIVSFIEIKYLPNYYPKYKKDIEKLTLYESAKSTFNLSIDPFTGKYDHIEYSKDNNCLYCFFVVGNKDSEAVYTIDTMKIPSNFHHFVALVDNKEVLFKTLN